MSTTDSKNLVYPHFNDPPVLPELNPAAAGPASLSSAGSRKLIEILHPQLRFDLRFEKSRKQVRYSKT